jgi:quercetin dioxygenase-like cupin family protein
LTTATLLPFADPEVFGRPKVADGWDEEERWCPTAAARWSRSPLPPLERCPARAAAWDALPQPQVAAGLGRRVLSGDQSTVIEIQLDRGVVLRTHAHPHEQFSHVTSGSMRLRTGPDLHREFVVNAGGVFHAPGGIVHEAEALEDSVVVEMFAPARDDLRSSV